MKWNKMFDDDNMKCFQFLFKLTLYVICSITKHITYKEDKDKQKISIHQTTYIFVLVQYLYMIVICPCIQIFHSWNWPEIDICSYISSAHIHTCINIPYKETFLSNAFAYFCFYNAFHIFGFNKFSYKNFVGVKNSVILYNNVVFMVDLF